MTFSVHGHPCHRTGYQQCHGSRDINLNRDINVTEQFINYVMALRIPSYIYRDINVTVQLRHIHVMENTLKVLAIRVQS